MYLPWRRSSEAFSRFDGSPAGVKRLEGLVAIAHDGSNGGLHVIQCVFSDVGRNDGIQYNGDSAPMYSSLDICHGYHVCRIEVRSAAHLSDVYSSGCA